MDDHLATPSEACREYASNVGADAEWLTSAGRGTDEDYGYYPDDGDEW